MLRRLAEASLIEYDPQARTAVIPPLTAGFCKTLEMRQRRAETTRIAVTAERESKIFISYRRSDTVKYVGRIYDRLTQEFGLDRVMLDVDSLAPGQDYSNVIRDLLQRSLVLIVLIGPDWLTAADSSGRRRIDDPLDFVRIEIENALNARVPVIPVLVGGATFSGPYELPSPLAPLSFRQALQIDDSRFQQDMDRLLGAIEEVDRGAKARTAPFEYSPAPSPIAHQSPTSVNWPAPVQSFGSPAPAAAAAVLAAPSSKWKWIATVIAAVLLIVVGTVWYMSTQRQDIPARTAKQPQPVGVDPSVNGQAKALFADAEAAYFGRGREQDYAAAAALYSKAAELGFAPAQNSLGRMYELGQGVPKKIDRAIHLYKQAAAQNYPEAQAALETLTKKKGK